MRLLFGRGWAQREGGHLEGPSECSLALALPGSCPDVLRPAAAGQCVPGGVCSVLASLICSPPLLENLRVYFACLY